MTNTTISHNELSSKLHKLVSMALDPRPLTTNNPKELLGVKISSPALPTVLPTQSLDMQHNMDTSPAYHDDTELVFPYMDYDRDNNFRLFVNNSKIISDDSGYFGQPYTPLTAPELDLVNVVRGHNMTHEGDFLYFYSNHKEELSWLIPAVFVGTFILFVIIYVSFYGFRSLRSKVMLFYFAVCRCCEVKVRSSREELDSLTSSMPQQQLEMGDYHANEDECEYDRFIL